MDLTSVAAAVVRGEPGAFINEVQGRSPDEMSAAALVLHRPGGSGFEVTTGGIGDAFRRHTKVSA